MNSLYLSTLDRTPDADGLTWWETQLAQSDNTLEIIAGFLASSEYHDRFLPAETDVQVSRIDEAEALALLGQPMPADLSMELLV